jgi:putative transcriptional regulator
MKNNLKEFRQENGLTQIQLANEIGVSRQTIISIESNRYTPSVTLSLKIAKFFNLTVEDIFQLEKSD